AVVPSVVRGPHQILFATAAVQSPVQQHWRGDASGAGPTRGRGPRLQLDSTGLAVATPVGLAPPAPVGVAPPIPVGLTPPPPPSASPLPPPSASPLPPPSASPLDCSAANPYIANNCLTCCNLWNFPDCTQCAPIFSCCPPSASPLPPPSASPLP
ncbi:hypothetical protein EMIHUDRAFT_458127, partial [Emiliania huxleyi CCMP1516]|uniref:Uncharacterized protein n=2 Tax=Emiliania huxleyi TaxID=2903 RepID=A0A0D3JGE6_EMIH1